MANSILTVLDEAIDMFHVEHGVHAQATIRMSQETYEELRKTLRPHMRFTDTGQPVGKDVAVEVRTYSGHIIAIDDGLEFCEVMVV